MVLAKLAGAVLLVIAAIAARPLARAASNARKMHRFDAIDGGKPPNGLGQSLSRGLEACTHLFEGPTFGRADYESERARHLSGLFAGCANGVGQCLGSVEHQQETGQQAWGAHSGDRPKQLLRARKYIV